MPLVHKAYKFRFYPTPEQEAQLRKTFGCVRFVYNKALEMRQSAWREERKNVSFADTTKALTAWKSSEEFAFLREISCKPLQYALMHLDASYKKFFAKTGGYPGFRKRRSKGSAVFSREAFRWKNGDLLLAKLSGPLKVVLSQPLPELEAASRLTVIEDEAGRWFVVLLYETIVNPKPDNDGQVGVDLGITDLATLSTGEKIPNPKHLEKNLKRLAKEQRRLSRKKRGSANRRKAARKVARVYSKIADARRDHLHKLSTRLVRENQTVAVETLNIKGMVKNRSLARAISDASWSELVRQLEYKAHWYGRKLVKVDRWLPSSKTCSECGHKMDKMPLKVRRWECPGCGASHDRDVNASRNILAAGLAVSACGGDVRPEEPMVPTAEPVKQERKGATPELPDLWI